MKSRIFDRSQLGRTGTLLAATLLLSTMAAANDVERAVLVLTSTNDANANQLVVFKLDTESPALSFEKLVPTQGKGGAGGNAGVLQFKDDFGAVANFGSNNVSRIVRHGDFIDIGGAIDLAPKCVKPDSLALTKEHLFVAGANCAESHAWPSGWLEGNVVALTDPSAAQISVGKEWAAVTMTSGSVLQLPLKNEALSGSSVPVTLPGTANNTPLGAAFWNNVLGFTPAHSPDSFALVNEDGTVFPIVGPTPSFPSNAPCWVAKGPGNIWYTGNSPGHAISIFLTDDQGGVFYRSVPLPGAPTDITVSEDKKWLAVIYSASGNAYLAVFAINSYGDLSQKATSSAIGIANFNGVAISE